MEGFIVDFNDTIMTHEFIEEVPDDIKYCAVILNPEGEYDLLSWDKKEEGVSPIRYQEELIVKWQKNRIQFRIGGMKKLYNVIREDDEVILVAHDTYVNTNW
ncbi:MAG: hypothetical protein HRT72_00875, partial [Flavobacteriales bacterium]|nr:hypothetical protein [Flavobacteriales bacterium]